VLKAAKKLLAYAGIKTGARIWLDKRIPIGAGLGGGSADAAATLVGLNQLWELNIPHVELEKIAVTLGADVPFCLRGGTVLATGIGEQLTDLPPLAALPIFLAKPPFSVSTKKIYNNLSLAAVECHPQVQLVADLIRQGEMMAPKDLGNLLEEVTLKLYPELKEAMAWFKKKGLPVRMSGSGPTLFLLDVNGYGHHWTEVEAELRERRWWTYHGSLQGSGLTVSKAHDNRNKEIFLQRKEKGES
jgi:4-diphosphocytidyl-2-C-methyl-D-erythritol kinase